MTPIIPIPIDPDLMYPVRLIWANGRIREMPGSYLLSTENPEHWRYTASIYPSSREVVNERFELSPV